MLKTFVTVTDGILEVSQRFGNEVSSHPTTKKEHIYESRRKEKDSNEEDEEDEDEDEEDEEDDTDEELLTNKSKSKVQAMPKVSQRQKAKEVKLLSAYPDPNAPKKPAGIDKVESLSKNKPNKRKYESDLKQYEASGSRARWLEKIEKFHAIRPPSNGPALFMKGKKDQWFITSIYFLFINGYMNNILFIYLYMYTTTEISRNYSSFANLLVSFWKEWKELSDNQRAEWDKKATTEYQKWKELKEQYTKEHKIPK
ncbi:hypothetical protein RFI_08445 [Reticulomyxa filosa]|uniref:Uncharacterized protein n=1 Tax=Reticulomyxa filosa TaxID=46433 RepID=X6NQV3_RETFI|nr:hypothetical protein RFI_08445 [Reticulomyxa filosa]|eukprot:ETO28685.1 hypothetical protein RFI_08445 [Reticulomyxa filosa]